jgi:hypothetical protein
MNETNEKPTAFTFNGGHNTIVLRSLDQLAPEEELELQPGTEDEPSVIDKIRTRIKTAMLGEVISLEDDGSGVTTIPGVLRLYERVRGNGEITEKQSNMLGAFVQEFKTTTSSIMGYLELMGQMPNRSDAQPGVF